LHQTEIFSFAPGILIQQVTIKNQGIKKGNSQSAEVAAGVTPSIAAGSQQQTPHQPGPSTSLQASAPSAPAATSLTL